MLRELRHPGPPSSERVVAAPVDLRPIESILRPGHDVLSEVARIFEEAGATGGVLTLSGGRCRPFSYVIPADSTDGLHAAWYSETYEAVDGADIVEAVAIVGHEDGRPFLHCHGRWRAGDGFPEAGHMLTPDSTVETPIAVRGLAAFGAVFERRPDEETAFSLFTPVASDPPASANGLLLRLRPGEDVVGAVETACHKAGVSSARIHGIGSVDGVRFMGGGRVECAATEIFIAGGRLQDGRAHLPVVVVDTQGTVADGVFEPGDNPVGVTFEIVVEDRQGRE